jgi:PTH1 family peptidyl-tRNA hydrolase
LGEWDDEERKTLSDRIDIAVEMIKSFSTIGLQRTMTLYNNK